MHTIRFSPQAIDDLINIKKYISEELDDNIAAMRIVSQIFARIDSLKDFPLLGEALEHKVNIHTAYRYLVCENYLAFYKVGDDLVTISRILYAKSNYVKILFP